MTTVTERHTPRESAMQRLGRHTAEFFGALARVFVLAGMLALIIVLAFLTVDLPFRPFDRFFGGAEAVQPSNWLTVGGLIMGAGPLLAMLFARKFGGEEANRAVTAAWALAAFAVFAELSYLAPMLEDGDFPSVRFVVGFVASAMASQYMAASVYDVARGGGAWWRAPLFGAIGGYLALGIVYFPYVYWGADVPWANWMVTDFAIRMGFAVAFFLPVYAMLRKTLRPRGGYGGK